MPFCPYCRKDLAASKFNVRKCGRLAGWCKKCFTLSKRKDRWEKWTGLSYKDLMKLKEKQNGVCQCCDKKVGVLVLDHCHDKNKFRGFICPMCNLGIGKLGDTSEGVQKALSYLKKVGE